LVVAATVDSIIIHTPSERMRIGFRETWCGNMANHEQGRALADVKISVHVYLQNEDALYRVWMRESSVFCTTNWR